MSYLYDDFGRTIQEIDANGKFTLYEYDLNNNLTKLTDAKSQVTTLSWHYGHLLASRTNLAAGNVAITYNHLGQVVTATTKAAGSASTNLIQYAYTYDSLNRLDTVTDSRGSVVLDYDFSPGGLLNRVKDSHGNETNYLYDATGRLSGLWAPNYGTVSYRYDAAGQLREKWLPNGVNTQYRWNVDGSLAQLVNRSASGEIVSQHDYLYDAFANRSQHSEKIGATTLSFAYSYDALSRLRGVSQTDPADATKEESYAYDPLGNLVQRTVGAPASATTAYVFDAANQLLEARQGSPGGTLLAAYVYDANGSLIKKCEGGSVTRSPTTCTGSSVTTLSYDTLDRLTQAVKGASTETFAYDHEGRRIRKVAGSTTTNFLYNGPDIHAQYGASFTNPSAQFVHGLNWDDPILRLTGSGAGATPSYYHQDGLGSVVAASSASGTIDGTQRFDAWGNKSASSGSIAVYGYTGREPDASGLIYYRARYYDPGMRRFTQRDPIGFEGGLNFYAYVGSNPVNFTDPSGLDVYIGGHVAADPLGKALSLVGQPVAYHLNIVMIPNNPQAFTNPQGWSNLGNGYKIATLGGQPGGSTSLGNLVSSPNDPGDSIFNATFLQRVETPKGMTDTQFINRLIRAANSYTGNLNYDLIPQAGTNGYNSNSYVSGVIKAAGGIPPILDTKGKFQTPGYDKEIPLSTGGASGSWARGASRSWDGTQNLQLFSNPPPTVFSPAPSLSSKK